MQLVPDVYFFGNGKADGGASDSHVLGGKGANLAEMTRLGIPVPPGFTISTAVCHKYLESRELSDELLAEIKASMAALEEATGKRFGDPKNPLLVSVRSGAPVSMPGMMDTILNLGLNDKTVVGLTRQSGNEGFALDSYRRFVQMYGNVVFGIWGTPQEGDPFERVLDLAKEEGNVDREIELGCPELGAITRSFKKIVSQRTGEEFPDDPWKQLTGAIEAVFSSWNTKRAVDYRRVHHIPDDLGTAVNVVAMVYGNMGEDSGTGVAFTRDPSTGEKTFYGEFLTNAQGEDVVAGTRDPLPIAEMAELFPEAFDQLLDTASKLEKHFRDMQDIEFTIERGKLFMLQTRCAKRTAGAAVRVAHDMVREGLLTKEQAVGRVDPDQLDQLLHPTIDPTVEHPILATGLPASPGAAVGKVVFDADEAVEQNEQGHPVVLVRTETSPDDFHGMAVAQAIVTARGGMTSHAAVVARGMGKCCVAGCKDLDIFETEGRFRVDGTVVKRGDWITVDGSTGNLHLGQLELVDQGLSEEFNQLMDWADGIKVLRVRANADTPADASKAREFGAQGIGLCRTEHMFFEGERIQSMREMILASNAEGRRRALAKLLPIQREDFLGIFRSMDGLPVTIRLLDPPLHEFLPRADNEIVELAENLGVTVEILRHQIDVLTENNPMLGHRGCRLGITYPEITEMQSRAIFEAACIADGEGIDVHPEIMIPLTSHHRELENQSAVVKATAERVFIEQKTRIRYLVGTMIELPRAALTADKIAETAEFFSFGTNDLTQTTLGLSRDDAGRFLPHYIETGIFNNDPFQTIDTDGVGKLIDTAVKLGRNENHKLKVGICGEHGGDPKSIHFCHEMGLDYVSCSPFRVPIARLAAAQASLNGHSTNGS